MSETILWEVHRSGADEPIIDRIVVADGTLSCRRANPATSPDGFFDLTPQPFESLEKLAQEKGEVLTVGFEDQVAVCGLDDDEIVLFVRPDMDGDEVYVELGRRTFVSRHQFFIPDDVEAVDSWSNGDNYDYPGGDKTSVLYGFDGLFVVDNWEYGAALLGRFGDVEDARNHWIEWHVPGGMEGYLRAAAEEE